MHAPPPSRVSACPPAACSCSFSRLLARHCRHRSRFNMQCFCAQVTTQLEDLESAHRRVVAAQLFKHFFENTSGSDSRPSDCVFRCFCSMFSLLYRLGHYWWFSTIWQRFDHSVNNPLRVLTAIVTPYLYRKEDLSCSSAGTCSAPQGQQW